MGKIRKKRSDSITKEGEMLRAKAPQPPAHIKLYSEDMPFWQSIMRARDFSCWTDSDLENAAILARTKADLERLQEEIRNEPDIVSNGAGSPIVNPKHKLIEDLTRRVIALSRMLHVHAEATGGESRKERNRNRKKKEVQADWSDDDLIAPPIQ